MTDYSGYEDNFDYLPDPINPFPEDKKAEPTMDSESDITQTSADQLNRGQSGIMDEDKHEGDIGSPVLSHLNGPSTKNYIRCSNCRRREEPSSPRFASWWNDGTGFPPYYCPTCVDKGEASIEQKQGTKTWYPFYSSVGDDDNPGYETDPEHGVSGRDTDDVEEDADSDYGGKNKRRNNLSDSNSATLVAMGGIGAIPEGTHGKDNVHYGDEESFSHEQSKTPSQTGISGENSKDFDPFNKDWNS